MDVSSSNKMSSAADDGTGDLSSAARPMNMLAAESVLNLALSDPPRWGWTAAGGIADLLPPHERSRRREAAVTFRKRKRKAISAASSTTTTTTTTTGKPSGKPDLASAATPASATPSSKKVDSTISGEPSHPSFAQIHPHSDTHVASPMRPNGQVQKQAIASPLFNVCTDIMEVKVCEGTIEGENVLARETVALLSSEATNSATWPLENQEVVMAVPSVSIPNNLIKEEEQQQQQQQHSTPKAVKSAIKKQARSSSKKSQPKQIDRGTKLAGVRSEFLGMSIERVDPQSTNSENVKESRKRARYECQVNSLGKSVDTGTDATVLDMYSYHRGREGFEPRNPDTGELLCPLEGTDTNANYDAPRLVVAVTVEFPLEQGTNASTDQTKLPLFRETLQWDLADPARPSPVVFATEIANDFGLDYTQMMDLAISIQQQIDAHLLQYSNYTTPIASKDGLGNERRSEEAAIRTHRYGEVLLVAPGGTRIVRKEKQRGQATGTSRQSISEPASKLRHRDAVTGPDQDEDIEPSLLEEVKRRTCAESSIDVAKKCENGVIGQMQRKESAQCHVCHKRCNVGYNFACGILSHAFCEQHCKVRLGDTFDEQNPVCAYCPICSLLCSCPKCTKRLDNVAREFLKATRQQGTSPEATVFDGILAKCRRVVTPQVKKGTDNGKDSTEVATTPKSSGKIRRSSTSKDTQSRLLVPKPPLSEFPREVHGSRELEPGDPEDYLTVYTANGNYLVDDFPKVWMEHQELGADNSETLPGNRGEAVDDGSVDYCVLCTNHGNLVCCDTCPRAFHVDCMESDGQSTMTDTWECPLCKKEREGLKSDLVDGNGALDLISSSFTLETDDNITKAKEAAGAIYLMLKQLIDYDFGYMFAVPVDAEAVAGYSDIVKNPMDLGTICAKLTNAGYLGIVENGGTYDDFLIAVLKDVELVWHNCYTFNFEGSAIYRMALVQQRRARAIQKRSFDHLLSDKVKEAVSDYVRACERERAEFNNNLPVDPTQDCFDKHKKLRLHRPKGKHKVTVKAPNSSVHKPVAIFDPVTARIVKIYSTLRSAGHAAHSMISLGHRCEWPSTQELVKQIVARSSSDPSILLFGYRWLALEDLKHGKVEFHRPEHERVELRRNGSTYVFSSRDAALSFVQIPKSISISDLRKDLTLVEPGKKWTALHGMEWRITSLQDDFSDRKTPEHEAKDVSTIPTADQNMEQLLQHCAIYKEDRVTERKVMGFVTFESAYQDWVWSAEASPTLDDSVEKTREAFQEFYLDGTRDIDGLIWRSQTPVPNDHDASKDETNSILLSSANGVADYGKTSSNHSPFEDPVVSIGNPTIEMGCEPGHSGVVNGVVDPMPIDDWPAPTTNVPTDYEVAETPKNAEPGNAISRGFSFLGLQFFNSSTAKQIDSAPERQISGASKDATTASSSF